MAESRVVGIVETSRDRRRLSSRRSHLIVTVLIVSLACRQVEASVAAVSTSAAASAGLMLRQIPLTSNSHQLDTTADADETANLASSHTSWQPEMSQITCCNGGTPIVPDNVSHDRRVMIITIEDCRLYSM